MTNTLHPEISEVKVQLHFDTGKTICFSPRQAEPVEAGACLKWLKDEEDNTDICQKFLAIKDK